jgi:hypothetical protein
MEEIKCCPLASGESPLCCGSACQWWDGADCAVKNIAVMLRVIASKMD